MTKKLTAISTLLGCTAVVYFGAISVATVIGFWLVALLITFVVVPLFKRFVRSKQLADGIPCVKGHWFLGHLNTYPPTQEGILRASKRAYEYPALSVVWYGPTEALLDCYHPDTIKPLMKNDVPKSSFPYDFFRPWLGNSLLTSSGEEWMQKRKLLARAFQPSVLKTYMPTFNECVDIMLGKWRNAGSEPVELFCDVRLMALDAVLKCTMSFAADPQNNHSKPGDYVEAMCNLSDMVMKRIFRPHLWNDALFRHSSLGKEFYAACEIVHKQSDKIIEKRKKTTDIENNNINCVFEHANGMLENCKNTKKLDFLDILLHCKDEDGEKLADIEIRNEVNTFLFAGHDTTSSAITWALYNLAIHEEMQNKCYEEIKDYADDLSYISWISLPKFNYMSLFIKESMRLYPPITGIARCPRTSMTIQHRFDPNFTKTVQGGNTVNVRFFDLHRHPKIWENPEDFIPERFLPENVSQRPKLSYLPFSTGSRDCIGQNFAMTIIKVAVAKTLLRYKLYIDLETPTPIMKPEVILRSENGVHVKLMKRYKC